MSSDSYTLHSYLKAAGVANPAAQTMRLRMAFVPRQDQVVGVNQLLLNNRFGLYDDPGCVSADTEFLHPTGWKRIDEWDGEQVAQFDPDLDAVSFTQPLRYVKEPCSEMLHLVAARGIDQMLSADHRVLTYSVTNRKRDGRVGQPQVCTAQELFDTQHKNTGRKIRTAFRLQGGPPADVCEGDLRLMVAVIADGYLPNQNSTCYMRLKKQRKIARIRHHLDGLGYPYLDKACAPDGFRMITFTAPRKEKEFTDWWWSLNPQQLAIVVDEARYWDGSTDARGNGSYSFHSRVERSADFIQYAASAIGRTANKYRYVRKDGSVDFVVRIMPGTAFVSGKPNSPWITRVPNPEGFKYCFQVPTGFLVLRRNGKVFLTGNCGKTVQMQAFSAHMVFEGNKVLLLMPPILLGQFLESLTETYPGVEDCMTWHVLTEGPTARDELFAEWDADAWPDLLLMSYELYRKLSAPDKRTRRRPESAHRLREIYRVVVCDEAHELCNHETILHSTLTWHLGEMDESALVLATGTPMPTSPLDAYGLIALTSPKAYSNYGQFERMHAIYKTIRLKNPIVARSGKKITHQRILDGVQRVEGIRKALYSRGRRIVKEQVLSLKAPTITEVPVTLSHEHLSLYKRLEKERILEFGGEIVAGGMSDPALRQALLRIVTNPERFAGRDLQNNVVGAARQLLQDHQIEAATEDGFPNKAIIFCNLHATSDWLQKVFAELNPAVLNGKTVNKDAARKKFLEDQTCRLLIANPESAGFGLNLQHVSRLCIFLEPTSIPGQFKQAMERIYRSGQAGVCYVYILRAAGTIAPAATKLMLERMEEIEKINRDPVALSRGVRTVKGRKKRTLTVPADAF